MKNWIKKHWLLTAFLLIGGVPAGLNYSGFCISQGRWLSDEERIQSVIKNLSNLDQIRIQTKENGWQYYQQLKYKNAEEFMQKNPECCKINPGGPYDLPPPSFMDRISGANSTKVIEVNFLAHYVGSDGQQQSQLIKSQSIQTNCGKHAKP